MIKLPASAAVAIQRKQSCITRGYTEDEELSMGIERSMDSNADRLGNSGWVERALEALSVGVLEILARVALEGARLAGGSGPPSHQATQAEARVLNWALVAERRSSRIGGHDLQTPGH